MVHVLVVGSGFLGKYLISSLLDRGDKVTVVDKANPDSLWSFPKLRNHQNSPNLVYRWQSSSDAMQLYSDFYKVEGKSDAWRRDNVGFIGIDAIVYTAAIADVPYAIKSPIDTYQVNVMNTVAFFEFLRMIDYDGRVIMMSSESTYGHQPEDKLPIKEDALPKPVSVYGASKLAQEQIALSYHRAYGIKSVVLKSGTMFGPYSRTKQMIPIFLNQILSHKPVTLEGDGTQTRDLVYVENTVDAIQKAMKPSRKIDGEIINIGSGKETRLINLVNGMKVILNEPTIGGREGFVPLEYKEFRAGEKGLRVWLDITKAKEKLDWIPKVALDDGLRYTAQWMGEVVGFDKQDLETLNQILWQHRLAIGSKPEHKKVGETETVEEQ